METFENFGFEREYAERASQRIIYFVRQHAHQWREVAEVAALEETAFTYTLLQRMALKAEGVHNEAVPARTRGEALITGYLLGFTFQKQFEEVAEIPVLTLPSYEDVIDTLTLSESSGALSLKTLVNVGREALENDKTLPLLFYELRDDLLKSRALMPFYEAGGGFCSAEFSGMSLGGYANEGVSELESLLQANAEAQQGIEDLERYLEDK